MANEGKTRRRSTGAGGRTRRRGGAVLTSVGMVLAWAVLVVWTPSVLADAPPAEEAADGVLAQLGGLDGAGVQTATRFLVLITVLSVVPSIVLLTTCFPRLVILLSFLRRALGTQDIPPQHVMTGLAFVLTGVVMMPVWSAVYETAYLPLRDGRVATVEEAVAIAEVPIKRFMLHHTLRDDLSLMVRIARERGVLDPGSDSPTRRIETAAELPFIVVLPAFVLSELQIAFQMGFLLFLPFVVIDLVVSTVLLSMGMFMLPPVLVSLPLKVLVFVLVDGWHLVVEQLTVSLY